MSNVNGVDDRAHRSSAESGSFGAVGVPAAAADELVWPLEPVGAWSASCCCCWPPLDSVFLRHLLFGFLSIVAFT
ncbi:hypothetical protein TSAR_003359 [Trichomalopsis sarcophagae]|uniref:Uncharacterized protein n=1 Tax=Trichomalopsis sarcophagae TaxID=543379 RepID=A0A232EXZ7_9HYME|nr:hypothetical protein TSAR_003359 [Trichomalopsis sarcophagae]